MIVITKDNYFGDNKGLSQSKIKDFLVCPNYFYRKHILKTVEQSESRALEIGKVVDDILTEEDNVENYSVFEGDRRTKDGKQEYQDLVDSGKKIVSQKEYDQIINIADSVIKTSAYDRLIKEFTFQEIIQIEANLGDNFDSYVGKPDAYKIEKDGTCVIVDIKTAADIDDRKFWYQSVKFGYLIQQWFYSFLLKRKYPSITGFNYYILAQEKSEPLGIKLFKIPNEYVDKQETVVVDAINRIIKEKEFKKDDASFDNPSILKDPSDNSFED